MAAVVFVLFWLASRWTIWQQGCPAPLTWRPSAMLREVWGQAMVLRRPRIGIFHLLIFWGCTIPLLLALAGLTGFPLPGPVFSSLSLVSEILAGCLLAATLFFLGRKPPLKQQPEKLGRLPLLLLLVIITTGLMAKGVRLNTPAGPQAALFMPLAWLTALPVPHDPATFHILIRLHLLAFGLFLATLPLSVLRHTLLAPLHLLVKKQYEPGALQPPSPEAPAGPRTIRDLQKPEILAADSCLNCGRCQDHCPASISGRPLSPARIMASIRQQAEKQPDQPLEQTISQEEVWSCTTCMACTSQCPIGLDPLRMVLHLRRWQLLGLAEPPAATGKILRNLETFGDVQGRGSGWRGEWCFDLDLPSTPSHESDILLWTGCFGSFDPGSRSAIRAMVKILRAAGLGFWVAKEEICCGAPARRLGDEELFRHCAVINIDWLRKKGARKIVTLCPHCLNTLKNEYTTFGADLEVVHSSRLLADLLQQGKISLKYPLKEKIAIHDPCYLSRANPTNSGIRQLIDGLPPGSETVEMAATGHESLCCGGGGGHLWLHDTLGQPMNHIRAQQTVNSDATLVATACPYCKPMLREGLAGIKAKRPPKVLDIVEIVSECLETAEG